MKFQTLPKADLSVTHVRTQPLSCKPCQFFNRNHATGSTSHMTHSNSTPSTPCGYHQAIIKLPPHRTRFQNNHCLSQKRKKSQTVEESLVDRPSKTYRLSHLISSSCRSSWWLAASNSASAKLTNAPLVICFRGSSAAHRPCNCCGGNRARSLSCLLDRLQSRPNLWQQFDLEPTAGACCVDSN